MRKYTLADSTKRGVVDLRDFTEIITAAVHEFAPEATVIVHEDHYYIDQTLSHGQSVRIGRKICESSLSKHCIQLTLSKLFIGKEVVHDNRNKQ